MSEPTTPPDEVHEADYVEQVTPVDEAVPDEETQAGADPTDLSSLEASEADVLEQQLDVPEDDDYPVG